MSLPIFWIACTGFIWLSSMFLILTHESGHLLFGVSMRHPLKVFCIGSRCKKHELRLKFHSVYVVIGFLPFSGATKFKTPQRLRTRRILALGGPVFSLVGAAIFWTILVQQYGSLEVYSNAIGNQSFHAFAAFCCVVQFSISAVVNWIPIRLGRSISDGFYIFRNPSKIG